MSQTDGWDRATPPFHAGEIALQERLGVRERVELFGRRAIRPFMPEAHRAFFRALPLIYAGHVDAAGRPWASVLVGGEGFVASPDARTLVIAARPLPGDPLAGALREGAPLGLLGLDAETRRRNRANGRVARVEPGRVTVAIEQSFGNCPQYIRRRAVRWRDDPSAPGPDGAAERLAGLDAAARAMIAAADTFFVATASRNAGPEAGLNGADVSHRGGRPGFVRVDGETLTIPDFPGNRHFNTLGNIEADPRTGLLFIDHARGDALMLTGEAELVWDGPEIAAFRGAERLWRLRATGALRLPGAIPLRWEAGEHSPNTLLTGDWAEAGAEAGPDAAPRRSRGR